MPRRKRNYLAGVPYHLVQRGNNRQRCFRGADDFSTYLDLWREKSHWYGVEVHAYCLMSNHIHFIVSGSAGDAISNTMKVVGSRYAYYFNRRHKRTGTLWEGRHRSSLIDAEHYLLRCYRYVELNPVRAGMVAAPGDYAWSSYALNTSTQPSWLVPQEVYLSLAPEAESRSRAYGALFAEVLGEDDLTLIRTAAHYSQPIGDEQFRKRVAERYGIPFGYLSRGRPRKGARESLVNI
jgi:putative transposase